MRWTRAAFSARVKRAARAPTRRSCDGRRCCRRDRARRADRIHGLAHGPGHRHGLDRNHSRQFLADEDFRHRSAAHVPGRPGDRARHDGRQRHRGGRRLRCEDRQGHGPQGCCDRSRAAADLAAARRHGGRSHGVLSDLRFGRGRWRVLPHALFGGGDLASGELVHLHATVDDHVAPQVLVDEPIDDEVGADEPAQ